MSQENVEIVRQVYEAAGRHDPGAVLAAYDTEVVFDFSRSPFRDVMERHVYHGAEGLRSLFRERSEFWETINDTCEELLDAGEHVISVVISRGRGRASRAEVERKHHGLWTFREGKIVRVAWFRTRAEALAAAGLSE